MSNKIPDGCTVDVPPEKLNSNETIYDCVQLIEEDPDTDSTLDCHEEELGVGGEGKTLDHARFCNIITRHIDELGIKNCRLRLDNLENRADANEVKQRLNRTIVNLLTRESRHIRGHAQFNSVLIMIITAVIIIWSIILAINKS